MAKLANIARMTTATTGTGTMTLGAAVGSFLSFADAGILNGDTVSYAIEDGTAREVGRGVYSSTGPTLTRTVLASTSAGSAINLSGTAEVFITALAEDLADAFDMANMSDSADAKVMTAAERSKLAGIATGATANATDAQLRDRSTHTGTQAISTVSGLQTALDGKATSDQGSKADTALQPAAIGVSVQAYDAATAKTDVAQTFAKPQRVSITTLTYAATVTPDLNANNAFILTMTGNPTIANPSNIASAVGQEVLLVFRGAYQPSFGSYYKFPGGTAPTFSGSLNAVGGTVISATEIIMHGAAGYA